MIGRWRQKKKSVEHEQKIDVVVLSYGDETALTKTLASVVASSMSFNSTTVVSPPKNTAAAVSSSATAESSESVSAENSDYFDIFRRLPEVIQDLRGDYFLFLKAGVCLKSIAPHRLLETLVPGQVHCLNLEVVGEEKRHAVPPPDNVFSLLTEVYEPWGILCSRALYREVGDLEAELLSTQWLSFFLRLYEKRGNVLATTREALLEVDDSDYEKGLIASYYEWCAAGNPEIIDELPGRQAEEQGLYHSLLAELCERHRGLFESLTGFFVPELLSKVRVLPELRQEIHRQKSKAKGAERAYHRVQERRRAAENSYKRVKEKREEALLAYKSLRGSYHALEAEANQLRGRISELEEQMISTSAQRMEFSRELTELEARKQTLEVKNSKLARKLREERLEKEPWL